MGAVSVTDRNSLMMPLFSVTKARPSGAKRTLVGFLSPPKTTTSWNPGAIAAYAPAGIEKSPSAASRPSHLVPMRCGHCIGHSSPTREGRR